MPDLIQLLPDAVVNQIAAGEVIQRPASAIKEMLENAIDAAATEISVILKEAGRTLIQVIDNGCGMSETDARMCFERHSTSKIHQADDLFAIFSYGFRGEALASIASISQVELKTKKHDAELGSCIEIEGSTVKNQYPVACQPGTSISVKNIFFNVPARRNFLKSNTAELRHIFDEFFRVAIAHPEVKFSLFHNNKPIYQLPAGNLRQRIVNIFGNHYNQKLVPLEQTSSLVNISGFIGKPEFSKKTRGEQYFFTNKRYIRHPYLHHSVENAYKELIPDDSYPTYFIFLEINPARIDINIHPTKTEINFLDSKDIYAVIQSTVRQSIGKYNITPAIDFDVETGLDIPPPQPGQPIRPPTITINPDYNPFEPRINHPARDHKKHIPGQWEKLYTDHLQKQEQEDQQGFPSQMDIPEQVPAQDPAIPTIFQLENRYIIARIKSGLVVIDQQYAHERILYERYLKVLQSSLNVSQQQLIPFQVDMSPVDADLVNELLPELHSIGFEIQPFGKNTFLVSSIPADLDRNEIRDILERIIENVKKNLDLSAERYTLVARTMARAAVSKRGKKLMEREMLSLVEQLFACQTPDVSPDGKQVLIKITTEELNKKFK